LLLHRDRIDFDAAPDLDICISLSNYLKSLTGEGGGKEKPLSASGILTGHRNQKGAKHVAKLAPNFKNTD
jgi:hypothetical protein